MPYIKHNVSNFRPVRRVGGGSLNAGIFLFQCPKYGKYYVRKYVSKDDVSRGLFQKEVDILKLLKGHKYVNSLIDYYIERDTGRGVMWLEYADEGTLLDVISKFRKHGQYFPEAFAWHVLRCLAGALAWCATGADMTASAVRRDWDPVLHRDIKPDNIFLTSQTGSPNPFPRVILADFGCGTTASRKNAQTRKPFQGNEGTLIGPYFPPGSESPSPKSDIWAVGASIAQCFGGALERNGGITSSLSSLKCSGAMQKILGLCLSPDACNRPSAAELYIFAGEHCAGCVERGEIKPPAVLPEWALPDTREKQPLLGSRHESGSSRYGPVADRGLPPSRTGSMHGASSSRYSSTPHGVSSASLLSRHSSMHVPSRYGSHHGPSHKGSGHGSLGASGRKPSNSIASSHVPPPSQVLSHSMHVPSRYVSHHYPSHKGSGHGSLGDSGRKPSNSVASSHAPSALQVSSHHPSLHVSQPRGSTHSSGSRLPSTSASRHVSCAPPAPHSAAAAHRPTYSSSLRTPSTPQSNRIKVGVENVRPSTGASATKPFLEVRKRNGHMEFVRHHGRG